MFTMITMVYLFIRIHDELIAVFAVYYFCLFIRTYFINFISIFNYINSDKETIVSFILYFWILNAIELCGGVQGNSGHRDYKIIIHSSAILLISYNMSKNPLIHYPSYLLCIRLEGINLIVKMLH